MCELSQQARNRSHQPSEDEPGCRFLYEPIAGTGLRPYQYNDSIEVSKACFTFIAEEVLVMKLVYMRQHTKLGRVRSICGENAKLIA